MITLNNPITIFKNNVLVATVKDLQPIIIDHKDRKLVLAKLFPCPKPVILWSKETYDQIGDYTQDQIDLRINEILGNNPEEFIRSLFE